MNYFNMNRKLISTIAAITAGIIFILWLNSDHTYLSLGGGFYIVTVIFCALMAIEAALIITAIWRFVMFARGDRRQAKYPLTIIAIAMILSGAFLSIGTYMNPVEKEISVTSCEYSNSSILYNSTPECYGKVTNPALWPSLALLAAGLGLGSVNAVRLSKHRTQDGLKNSH
jgi:uncharacterized membrane protein YidH (DUF202 family)